MKNIKIHFIVGFLLFINLIFYSQSQWPARYNGPMSNSYDEATSIAADNAGNVYVTGRSQNYNGSKYEITTVKYDIDGYLLREWRYSDDGVDNIGESIAVYFDGTSTFIYVAGKIQKSSSDRDCIVLMYNSTNSSPVWLATYNGPGNGTDVANHIEVDNSGNAYITGESLGNGTNQDFVTIKYNSFGVQQWVARYNNGPTDIAYSLKVDDNQKVFVTGKSYSESTGSDIVTIGYNQNGVQAWVAS